MKKVKKDPKPREFPYREIPYRVEQELVRLHSLLKDPSVVNDVRAWATQRISIIHRNYFEEKIYNSHVLTGFNASGRLERL